MLVCGLEGLAPILDVNTPRWARFTSTDSGTGLYESPVQRLNPKGVGGIVAVRNIRGSSGRLDQRLRVPRCNESGFKPDQQL